MKVLPLPIVTLAALIASAPARAAADVHLAEEVVVVPFDHAGRHVAVTVEVGGRVLNFQVDTYASIDACIDDDVARELDLEITGSTLNGDGRNQVQRDIARIDELKLGGATFSGLRTLVDDYGWLKTRSGEPMHGLLGFGAFEQLLVTFDYPGSRLVLTRGALDRSAPHTLAFDADNGAPNIDLTIGGASMRFGIDTGSASGLSMSLEQAERFELHGEPIRVGRARSAYSEFDLFLAALKEPVGLAGHELQPAFVRLREGGERALIGYLTLRTFAVTFDRANELVRFERPPWPEGVALSDDAAARWVGTYRAARQQFTIEHVDGELMLHQGELPPVGTIALSEDELLMRQTPVRVRRGRNSFGREVIFVHEHPDLDPLEAVRVAD